MVIIRRDGVNMEGHVDFIVRREKVRLALLYKIEHDPAYADLEAPDPAMLAQLPENGSAVDRVPTCREGSQDGGGAGPAAGMPTGPVDAAASAADDHDEGGTNMLDIGGVLDAGGTREEVASIRQGANAVVQGPVYDQTIVQASSGCEPNRREHARLHGDGVPDPLSRRGG
ncbi:hypothetical protein B0H12DRAFT_504546 [Mycena haematopus]|nr:hypothetical protein B0H12DRAFT_504546 [Mycena haematopus]